MRLIFLLVAICCTIGKICAQTVACTRQLERAEEAFDQGRLLDVLEILNKETGAAKACFLSFAKEEKIRAEKLLTKVYIFIDNVPEAEESLVNLLSEDKEHQLQKDDPSELHFLYSQFRTEPLFRLGVRLSINKSLPSVLNSFNTLQVGEKKYNTAGSSGSLGIGGSLEALVERHIKKGIEVAAGAQIRIAAYDVEGDLLAEPGQLFYNVTNRSTMLRVPVLGRYTWNYDAKNSEGLRLTKLPYAFAGVAFDFILDARYVNSDRTGGTAFTLNENNSLSSLDQVASTNVSVFLGAGVKLRMGRAKVDFLTVELRFDNSLFNYINPDNRFANRDVNFDIGHVEDDLTLNTISISAGYTLSFYNYKKRKQYR